MITVVIQGGLGNQLFQYAYGRALMVRGKDVVYDISFYSTDHEFTKRPYLLEKFFISDSIKTVRNRPPQSMLTRILNKIDVDRRVRYVNVSAVKDNYLADGYYTSEKYFKDIRDLLLKEIDLKEKSDAYLTWKEKIKAAHKPLVIHARRTDYVGSGFVNLDKSYYERALSYFDNDCDIFAFSDDITWLEEVLDRKVTAVSGNGLTDYEELMLMKEGENFIIANSTFSWWGAWLSVHPNKKVVAPKKWFKSVLWWRANRDTVPESWIAI